MRYESLEMGEIFALNTMVVDSRKYGSWLYE